MSKFLAPENVYKDRIKICQSCEFYFKLTGNCRVCGCFMSLKARIGALECPKKYWGKTTEVTIKEELPEEVINEVLQLWEHLKTGVAKTQEDKQKMIELWNVISGSNYNPRSNCGSCVSACFDGIKKVYYKYKKK